MNRDKLIDAKIISGKSALEKKLPEATQGEIKSSEQIIEEILEEKEDLENKHLEESLLGKEMRTLEENQAPQKPEEKMEENKEPENTAEQNQAGQSPELTTLKKPEREMTPEEREKIKKIAFGFFGGGNKPGEGQK